MKDPNEIISWGTGNPNDLLSTFGMPDPTPTTVVREPTTLIVDPDVGADLLAEVKPMLVNAGYNVVESTDSGTKTLAEIVDKMPFHLLNHPIARPEGPPPVHVGPRSRWRVGSGKKRDLSAEKKARKQASKSRRINRKK